MTIARVHIIQLLKRYNCREFGERFGSEVWVTPSPDNLIVRIPREGPVHLDIVELIALEQLNMGMWEFDYWLGQIGFQLN